MNLLELVKMVKISFYRGKNQFPPVHAYLRHGSVWVSGGKELIFTTMEIDFYRLGN